MRLYLAFIFCLFFWPTFLESYPSTSFHLLLDLFKPKPETTGPPVLKAAVYFDFVPEFVRNEYMAMYLLIEKYLVHYFKTHLGICATLDFIKFLPDRYSVKFFPYLPQGFKSLT